MHDITAVLITREVEYPNIVLERLTCMDFFQDILIVTECPSIYHRYLAAGQAKTNHIFVMDDDCMTNYQVLFRSYNGQITNAMPLDFQEKYNALHCTLLGWGCFFPKSMLTSLDKYIAVYGVDNHLLREADRIFSSLNQPFNTVTLPHEDLFQTPDRMSFQDEHYQSMLEALEKVKAIK
jgi:hypothetical protein